MEEKKSSVLRVLSDISGEKLLTNIDSIRSLKETPESTNSVEHQRNLQQTKRTLQKKNLLHPLLVNHPYRCASFHVPRVLSSRPKPKDASQRIVSAKLLQIKELRNQLTLTQHELNEVSNENRFLKTLQKRQETALKKYEGHEAKLPQLIQAHAEELRVLNTKLKQVKLTNQRLVEKLKIAEGQLSSLKDQHCHLVDLTRDQQLGERETLALQVRDLEMSLHDKTTTIQLLTRKVDLERKNYKHELLIEKNKRNDVERKLSLAMQTIEHLKDQIEAKEKCMNAIVPSRYVRGPSQLTHNNMRLTHSQIPRSPPKQNAVVTNSTNHINQSFVRSSRDQTEDELDVTESHSSKTTSDSSRTLSGQTLPRIKPQLSGRALRNQYKMSSKRGENKELALNNHEDYSSSFTSVDVSLRKTSDSDSDKLMQSNHQSSRMNRSRKLSIDSQVTTKCNNDKIDQTLKKSGVSSSRRSSIAACPQVSKTKDDQSLQHESTAAKEDAHNTIRKELKELEEQLLKGSNFLRKASTQSSTNHQDEEPMKERSSNDLKDENERESLDDDVWSSIHDKVKAESEATEAKLEDYYKTLEQSELNLEDEESCIALEQDQKNQLLNALKEIDREAGGVSSESSIEDAEPSSSLQRTRRKSDGFNYNFTKNIENLHKGRPVHNEIKIPVIEKMKREEKMYLSNSESGKKSKTDFMKELFGNIDVGLHN